jgi:acyl-CoA thioester hydrolase
MTAMIETYRSIVHPWECDSVDHFTTAYYFAAFASANWHLLQRTGLNQRQIARLQPQSCQTRFMRELRAGDPYHIVSGLLESRRRSVVVGHRLFNSETGAPSASHAQTFASATDMVIAAEPIDWPEERPLDKVAFDRLAVWSPTAANIVQSRDLDHSGTLSLATLIHCASDANVQFQNRIGMTSSYMRENLIGFATMAYQIVIGELPSSAGVIIEIESALAHLGRSSLCFAHRVVDGRSRAPHRHRGPVRGAFRPPTPPQRRDPRDDPKHGRDASAGLATFSPVMPGPRAGHPGP